MTIVKVGSVWMKKHGKCFSEAGQLIVVECINETKIVQYRYCSIASHETASWPIDSFLKRMELIEDV